MSRKHSKPLSAIVAQTRRIAQKAALNRGVVYCSNKSCGWGWELREGAKCPRCGSLPEGFEEEKKRSAAAKGKIKPEDKEIKTADAPGKNEVSPPPTHADVEQANGDEGQ